MQVRRYGVPNKQFVDFGPCSLELLSDIPSRTLIRSPQEYKSSQKSTKRSTIFNVLLLHEPLWRRYVSVLQSSLAQRYEVLLGPASRVSPPTAPPWRCSSCLPMACRAQSRIVKSLVFSIGVGHDAAHTGYGCLYSVNQAVGSVCGCCARLSINLRINSKSTP